MAWTYSKRCRTALKQGKLKVSLPSSARIRIWKCFAAFDEVFYETSETGFNYTVTLLERVFERLKDELGTEELLAFPQNGEVQRPVPSDFHGFVLRGNYPSYLFDALEIYHLLIFDEGRRSAFQTGLNEIFEEGNLPWRMAEGKVFPIDSAYIQEEITGRAYELLREVGFSGALMEFEKARVALINGDTQGAIQNANLAMESTVKGILKVERAKPGSLYRQLIDSGLVPEYYRGFLQAFEENILRAVAIMRNEELGVGHGQGVTVNEVPKPLAELCLHLSGVMINFLIKRYIETARAVE